VRKQGGEWNVRSGGGARGDEGGRGVAVRENRGWVCVVAGDGEMTGEEGQVELGFSYLLPCSSFRVINIYILVGHPSSTR
jgi:hypothetical protein